MNDECVPYVRVSSCFAHISLKSLRARLLAGEKIDIG